VENRTDITVPMPERMVEEINGQLEYGDSRAAWIREAVRAELQRSGAETDCTEEKKNNLGAVAGGGEGGRARRTDAAGG
jgi:Arc/MetJ-type ribon-helix-helix transcriptional regulator